MTGKQSLLLTLSLMGATAAWAACPGVPTASRYSFNAAGDEVTDSQTGLVWARCSVGQHWDGSACSGVASTHAHEQALSLAQAASGWRLPNVRELNGIADKGCRNPAIDSTAFPNTSSDWYWASSPNGGHADRAWGVFFDGGYVYDAGRHVGGAVRLVRASR